MHTHGLGDKPAASGYRLPLYLHSRRKPMSWPVWLVIAAALGSIVGSLLLLRDARTPPLSEEQLARMHARNQQLEEQEKKER